MTATHSRPGTILDRCNARARSFASRALRKGRRVWARLLGRRMTQIVICGYPRSGTSLFYNMMAATLKGFGFDSYENSYRKYLHRQGDYISKRPHDVLEVAKIPAENRLGKRVWVIVLLRDLRDIITSVHPRIPDDYFIGYEACYRGEGPDGWDPALVNPGIREVHEAIERLRTLKGIELVILRYEDLVNDPDGVQALLARRLGNRFEGRFSSFWERGKDLAFQYAGRYAPQDASLVRENKPVDPSRINKWRDERYRERIRDQFTAHPELFEILKQYGYETDDRWFDSYREQS